MDKLEDNREHFYEGNNGKSKIHTETIIAADRVTYLIIPIIVRYQKMHISHTTVILRVLYRLGLPLSISFKNTQITSRMAVGEANEAKMIAFPSG